MEYIVEIGFNKFSFDSAIDALTFANAAKEHYICEKYDHDDVRKDIDVTIEVIKKDEVKED